LLAQPVRAGRDAVTTAPPIPTTTMDFFAREERAHRTSRRLGWMFLLAVLATLLTLNLATHVALNAYLARGALAPGGNPYRHRGEPVAALPMDAQAQLRLRLEVHAAVTLSAIAIILLGSLWKISQLGGGGATVAAMMGGREVGHDPRDAQERMLVNVVEEMSIASGVPMPAVYVLDHEAGVNAFAAGHHSSDAVVAVTRGCIERLDRQELQGVIGHEFSHLLNGDMRLNLRLMGLVHGLLVIGLTGALLMRMCSYSGGSRRDNRGVIAILIIGLAIYVIGYIGFFFGGLIKAAMSRQREYLADASSVQFTRNPGGLAGALKKLGAGYQDATVENPNSHEASHFFFGNAVSGTFFGLLATHPPLESRIRAIDPRWDGRYPESSPVAHDEDGWRARDSSPVTPIAPAGVHPAGHPGFAPLAVIARIGTVSPEHVDFSAALLASIPATVAQAAREPFSARAVALCLLLDPDPARARPLIEELEGRDSGLGGAVRRLHPAVGTLGQGAHLPILDLCVPALRQLSPSQRETYLAEVRTCARQGQSRLSSYCMATLLAARLSDSGPRRAAPGGTILAILPLWPHLAVLLSALARAGVEPGVGEPGAGDAAVQAAFTAAVQRLLPDQASTRVMPAEACGPDQLDAALGGIDRAAPEVKRRIVTACAWCVAADGVVTVAEAELLRVIAICLGCPMPPFAPQASAA
jgi:Zn-dependent protease with chaperone function